MDVKTGGDHRDGHLILGRFIEHRAKDDVRILAGKLLDIAGRLIGFDQADITGDVDDHMGRTLDGGL